MWPSPLLQIHVIPCPFFCHHQLCCKDNCIFAMIIVVVLLPIDYGNNFVIMQHEDTWMPHLWFFWGRFGRFLDVSVVQKLSFISLASCSNSSRYISSVTSTSTSLWPRNASSPNLSTVVGNFHFPPLSAIHIFWVSHCNCNIRSRSWFISLPHCNAS